MQPRGLIAAWALPVTIGLIGGILLLLGDDAALKLRYDRAAIASGQLLRFVSGHGVHLGLAHYLLNIAGLALVWYLVGAAFSVTHWLLILVSSIVLIDLGLWFLMPGLAWYVGLSGLLHGMLAAGVPGVWRTQRREAIMIAGILLAKLGYEALVGPIPGSGATAGGEVITEVHLLGALGGFAAGMLFSNRVQPEASI